MIDMEQKIREKLEAEAAQWVEEELVRRMAYATDAIENQADISSIICGEAGAKKHIRDASAFAEEGIRQELEFEMTGWVEEKMR